MTLRTGDRVTLSAAYRTATHAGPGSRGTVMDVEKVASQYRTEVDVWVRWDHHFIVHRYEAWQITKLSIIDLIGDLVRPG